MDHIKNILIVDDDDFVRSILEAALAEFAEYDTVTAASAQDAIDILHKRKFDLVITDILMPGKDGIELINELRKIDEDVPVIAISGGDESGQSRHYLDFACYYANETLRKPFSKQELLETMTMVLSHNNSDFMRFL